MKDPVLYHNPRCSKSRAALALLEEGGHAPAVVRYLETPPDADTIATICRALGVHPTEVIRTGEKVFRELGLSLDDARDEADWCALLAEHPILLQRPILVDGDRAVIGRPPERVLTLG